MKVITKEKWWDLLKTPQAWMLWGIREIKANEVGQKDFFMSPQGKLYVADRDSLHMMQFVSSN